MQDIRILAEEFKACQKILLALGDEMRQHLILEMMQMGECGGVRVGAITERTNSQYRSVPCHSSHYSDRDEEKTCLNRVLRIIE